MARTYKRDRLGRFAGGGGGGGGSRRPPVRQVSRERNRLTRDNSGRITGIGGSGATARGGRLRTGAGNLRATQTDRLKGRIAGTVRKPKGLKAQAGVNIQTGRKTATSKLRPGELMNANARPVNTMARFRKSPETFKKTKRENLATAEQMIKAKGYKPTVDTKRNSQGVAAAFPGMDYIKLVKNSPFWSNPQKLMREQRRQGHWSSSDPRGVIFHEVGHMKDRKPGKVRDASQPWGIGQRPFMNERNARLARRVSKYATTSSPEFVAETYAGLRTGRRYDYQVMRAYREEMGLSPTPAARRRSRRR